MNSRPHPAAQLSYGKPATSAYALSALRFHWILRSYYSDRERWSAMAIPLSGWRANWVDLAIALRARLTPAYQILLLQVKPKRPKIPPARTPRKVVSIAGDWWVKWEVEGSTKRGEPAISLEFKRPLDADELMCLIGQLATFDKSRPN